MIENTEQLAATIDYISKWADTLEGMRRYEEDKDGALFSRMAAGPLNEIRQNLAEVRTFLAAKQETGEVTNGVQARFAVASAKSPVAVED